MDRDLALIEDRVLNFVRGSNAQLLLRAGSARAIADEAFEVGNDAATDVAALATVVATKLDAEGVDDRVAALIQNGVGITWVYNDGAGTLTPVITWPIRTITGTATLGATDHTVICDATSGSYSVNLPAASGCSGRVYIVKKSDATANTVTVDPNSSETIDGAATKVLSAQWQSMTVQSDGTGWFLLATT